MSQTTPTQAANNLKRVATEIDAIANKMDAWLSATNVARLMKDRDTAEVKAMAAALPGLRRALQSMLAVTRRVEQATRCEGNSDV